MTIMRLKHLASFLWIPSVTWCLSAPTPKKRAPFLSSSSSSASLAENKAETCSASSNEEQPQPQQLMTKGGANLEAFFRGHVPWTREIEPTVLEMDLPDDFPAGSYFKVGAGGFESNDGVQVVHQFDSNGKVLGLTFDPARNRVLYRFKHVQTLKYQQDLQTQTMPERGFFGTRRSGGWLANVGRVTPANVANTNVILNEGRDKLFCLWEAGRPFQLDPLTLDTVGETDCGFLGDNTGFSAHPRYDPIKKTYINFCLKTQPDANGMTSMKWVELDADSLEPISPGISLDMPGLMLTHDFCLTDEYIVFNWVQARVNGLNALQALLGLKAPFSLVELVPDQDAVAFVAIPRTLLETGEEHVDVLQDDRIKVIQAAPFRLGFHFGNAYDTKDGNNNNKVVMETICNFDQPKLEYGSELMEKGGNTLWEALDYDNMYCHSLERYELDMDACQVVNHKTLGRQSLEFPTMPMRMQSKPHTYTYVLGSHGEYEDEQEGGFSPFGSVRKLHVENLAQDVFRLEPHEFVQDPGVCNKVGSTKEDGVYLVAVVTNGIDLTSDLVILDGENLSQGPVSKLRLPEILPHSGIHGNFYEGATYPF